MAKAPADTIKYNIYAEINIDGVVEKPDVVGAIFGQSEGLLGEDLELRDLQKTGRIGRIEVDLRTKGGKSTGTLIVPSSLDMVETSIIASAVETVDRVGPCNATIKVTNVEDARGTKRKAMVERAKSILTKLMDEEIPETEALTEEVRKSVQLAEIITYKGLPSGPGVETADSVIIVEGRADVLNLLKCGIKNAVAVGGTNVPRVIREISKSKTAIAFVDGDRGGDIILKELAQVADIDFVARAPPGKEVEELGKKEVIMALRRKAPLNQLPSENNSNIEQTNETTTHDEDPLKKELADVKGKLMARLFDENLKRLEEVEIKDLITAIVNIKPKYVVFDGIVTQRIIDAAALNSVKCIVGVSKSGDINNMKNIQVITDDTPTHNNT
ncbi:DNA primase DnaG [uncultured archaeon]|nr:DNA primase DnaG [uncultured archaeon]